MFLTKVSLSDADLPEYFSSRKNAGFTESAGLSVQISSTRSLSYLIVAFFFSMAALILLPSAELITLPSKPSTPFSGMLSSMYFDIVGTPSSPIRISSIVLPESSLSAWIKYLPSVQRAALSFPTKRLPAEPVKPDIYFLTPKCSPAYSDS